METRPPIAPFSDIDKSYLPNNIFENTNAAITPPAAAAFVLTNISATALASATFETINSDPPLKPNHPIHNMNVPSVANGILAPGMANILPSTYFPFLAPNNITPASAAAAPHKCTTPDPAKSEKPAASRKPPPHFQ